MSAFFPYEQKSFWAGLHIGQGLKGRGHAPKEYADASPGEEEEVAVGEAPTGFPQNLWNEASERYASFLTYFNTGTSSGLTWRYDEKSFLSGLAVGASLEGWESDANLSGFPEGVVRIAYYIRLSQATAVEARVLGDTGDGHICFIDWGDGDIQRVDHTGRGQTETEKTVRGTHQYSEGEYVLSFVSNFAVSPGGTAASNGASRAVFAQNNSSYGIARSVCLYGNIPGIGKMAFQNSTNLEHVHISAAPMETIGENAFALCSLLTEFLIPRTVTQIQDSAFEYSGLTSIAFPASVYSIGAKAFKNTQLSGVTIPANVKRVGGGAFAECSRLTSASVEAEPGSPPVFDRVTRLTSGNINAIFDYGVFTLCANLNSVTLHEGLTATGRYCFAGCSRLGRITLPSSLITISHDTFRSCSGLSEVVIQGNVTSIESNAFRNCGSLRTPTIPGSVTRIWDEAFYGCGGMVSPITIPNGVTIIERATFRSCSNLTGVSLPNGLTEIEDDAFQYCSRLNNVTIPDSVNSIGDDAFNGCESLKSVSIPSGVRFALSENYAESVNNTIQVYERGKRAFQDCKSLESVTLGYGVDIIPGGMFWNCRKLTSIEIPNSVRVIGSRAFQQSGIGSLEIPGDVTYIGEYAFYSTSISSITIPYGVKSVWEKTFYGCQNLSSITIPTSVNYIAADAFQYSGITGIGYAGTVEQWENGVCVQRGEAINSMPIHCSDDDTTVSQAMYYMLHFESNGGYGRMDDILADGRRTPYVIIGSRLVRGVVMPQCLFSPPYETQYFLKWKYYGKYEEVFPQQGQRVALGDFSQGRNVIYAEWGRYSGYGQTGDVYWGTIRATKSYAPQYNASDESFTAAFALRGSGETADYESVSVNLTYDNLYNHHPSPYYSKSFRHWSLNSGEFTASAGAVVIGLGVTRIGDNFFGDQNTVTTIYYQGTSADWAQVVIGEGNSALNGATVHYESQGPGTWDEYVKW